MAAPPPYPPSAVSVSRSKISRDKVKSDADTMLRTFLAGGSAAPASSTSVTRSAIGKQDVKSIADDTSRMSLSSSQSPTSSASIDTQLPPYRATSSSKNTSPLSSRKLSDTVDSIKGRKLQLEREISQKNKEFSPRNTDGLFRRACSTDLLFVIDTTASMGPYIEEAKTQVRNIVTDIKSAFLNESQVRIGIVSYKDHGDYPNVEFLDFTASTDEVHAFLSKLRATGGADAPEDALGGLQKALNASWQFQTRCLIHIADAPAHGSDLHDLGAYADSYHEPGSQPHGLTYRSLITGLVQLKVNYAFLRISSYTDKMTFTFSDVYGPGNVKLHPENTYYGRATTPSEAGYRFGSKTSSVQPQFEEAQLGTTYSALRHLVVKSVTTSVSRTAGRLSLALARTGKMPAAPSPMGLTSVMEDETTVGPSGERGGTVKIPLDSAPPQWNTPGWFDDRKEVEGFLPAIVVHHANTLGDMMAADENIKLSVAEFTIYARSKPFGQGAMRKAFYARTALSNNRYVVKSFLRDGHSRAEVAEDMRMQALCKAFALEFNGLLKIEPPLDFVVSSCLQSKEKAASKTGFDSLSLEPYIEGEYVKYNNNGGYVNEELAADAFNQVAQAFSHFTFERSWGHFLVSDLQGVGHLLTDPAVQTRDTERFKLNDTNLNEEGFKFFFSTHKCNLYCHKLELRSSGLMFASGKWEFRPRWPTMEPTVCCSNKLCRSIIREKKAHKSNKFPGHNWCDSCWSQIEASTSSWICIEPGPNHEFEVSRFYHESQGQLTPKRCPEHRQKHSSETGGAAVGGSMWNKMKSKVPKGSISGKSW